ncbi:MAG: N-acetylmuramoyl-L-alanine amidase [Tagaea sp.]|nr:N-acetylmuramoyl-L-alanine amidase [Tagaea sp.]
MLWARRLFAALFAVGLGVGAAVAQAPARPPGAGNIAVQSVGLADSPWGTRLTVEVSRRVEYRVFFLAEPMRAVVDLPAVAWRHQANVPDPRGLIAGLRYGAFDAQTGRLVLDLSGPARVREARFELPARQGAGHRLVIEFERSTQEAFARDVQPWSASGVLRAMQANMPPLPGQSPPASQAPPPPPSPQVAQAPRAVPPPPAAQAPAPPQQAAAPRAVPAPEPPRRLAARPTIVLDPGHGGVDPGAIGAGGTHEKEITLAMAREIRRQLEQTGRYRVHLTRDEDIFVRLRDRIAIARQHSADLFVSVHADSMGNRETRGASIYTLSENASDSEAAALAARENRADIIAGVDLSRESRDVTSILIDLAQRETMNHSIVFARALVQEMGREVALLPVNPHRFAGFAVLRAPDVPSVLIELGYLSNPQEESLLNRPQHRARVATGIVRAVDSYFARNPRRG